MCSCGRSPVGVSERREDPVEGSSGGWPGPPALAMAPFHPARRQHEGVRSHTVGRHPLDIEKRLLVSGRPHATSSLRSVRAKAVNALSAR